MSSHLKGVRSGAAWLQGGCVPGCRCSGEAILRPQICGVLPRVAIFLSGHAFRTHLHSSQSPACACTIVNFFLVQGATESRLPSLSSQPFQKLLSRIVKSKNLNKNLSLFFSTIAALFYFTVIFFEDVYLTYFFGKHAELIFLLFSYMFIFILFPSFYFILFYLFFLPMVFVQ